MHEGRSRYQALQQKYFGIKKIITECKDPLSALMTRSTQDLSGSTGT